MLLLKLVLFLYYLGLIAICDANYKTSTTMEELISDLDTTTDSVSQNNQNGMVTILPTDIVQKKSVTISGDQLVWSTIQTNFPDKNLFFYGSLWSSSINPNNPSISIAKRIVKGSLHSRFWALAQNFNRNLIYYADYRTNTLGILNTNTGAHKNIFKGLSHGIDGLAVDWLSGNIYWIDTDLQRIMVGDSTLSYYKSLIHIDSLVPAKIAVDPFRNALYWSEINSSRTNCRIYKSDLSGNNVMLLHLLNDTSSIYELVMDVNENKLYWTDLTALQNSVRMSRVRSINLENYREITTVYAGVFYRFHGLASYKNVLYVSNLQHGTILLLNKTSNAFNLISTFVIPSHLPRLLLLFGSYTQPLTINQQQPHPCSSHDCEQICLTNGPSDHVCTCTKGYFLNRDNRTCSVQIINENFALLTDATHSKIYQISLTNSTLLSALPLSEIGSPEDADFDYVTERIYWSDTNSERILRSYLNGSHWEIFIDSMHIDSLAIDPVSRNLYAADSQLDSIIVASLDLPNATSTLQVQDIHRVWKLVISHQRRKIFWTDWGQHNFSPVSLSRVESINFDGSGREILVNGTNSPYGLTIDESSSTLYWTEYVSSTVGWMNLNTLVKGKFNAELSSSTRYKRLSGISFFSGYLYLIDSFLPNIYRVTVSDVQSNNTSNGGGVLPYGPFSFYFLTSIRTVLFNSSIQGGSNPCSDNRGGCPQVCLPSGENRKCVCQDHSTYIKENRTCTAIYLANDTIPPSFGDTCPDEPSRITTEPCSNRAIFNFTEPEATDNSGKVLIVKRVVKQPPPYNLSLGGYVFLYKAQDHNQNQGICYVSVSVSYSQLCSPTPQIPAHAKIGKPSCNNHYGSVIDVFCYGNTTEPAFQYYCNDGNWEVLDGKAAFCVPQSMTTTIKTSIREKPTTSASSEQTTTSTVTTVAGKGGDKGTRTGNSGLSSGGVAAIAIAVVVLVIVIAVIVIKRYHVAWLPSNIFWRHGDDRIHLTSNFDSLGNSHTTEDPKVYFT